MENYLQLVKQAKRGDVESFARLYEQVYQKLYRFALYTLCNREDAEDVASDAVADAFASIGKLRREEAFQGWIFKILGNKCKRKLAEYANRAVELTEAFPEPADTGEFTEALQVRQLFFALPEEDRMIIGLHLFGGYTSREIGNFLQMNENTVRSRESRALKRLGELLA